MIKKPKGNGPATAAFLIKMGIEQLQASPTLRKKTGISLFDLNAAEKIGRQLVKDSKIQE